MIGASPLDVATPERVALDLPLAGIGYRSLAYLIDALVLFGAWAALFFGATLVSDDLGLQFAGLSTLLQVLLIAGAFAAQWMSWTLFETFWGGRTLGKRAMGIRVVRLDGSPVGFFEAAVRNLLRVIDFLPMAYAVGICALLITRRNRRIGDLLAGTVVVRDVRADLDRYRRIDAPVAVAALAPADAELVLDFLARAPSLSPEPRAALTAQLLARFGPELSPEERARLAGTPAAAERYLRARAQGGA
jgi:uncharacterized RDD family membrane protein YckC